MLEMGMKLWISTLNNLHNLAVPWTILLVLSTQIPMEGQGRLSEVTTPPVMTCGVDSGHEDVSVVGGVPSNVQIPDYGLSCQIEQEHVGSDTP